MFNRFSSGLGPPSSRLTIKTFRHLLQPFVVNSLRPVEFVAVGRTVAVDFEVRRRELAFHRAGTLPVDEVRARFARLSAMLLELVALGEGRKVALLGAFACITFVLKHWRIATLLWLLLGFRVPTPLRNLVSGMP